MAEIQEFPIGLAAKVIAPDGAESDAKLIRGNKGVCVGTTSVENIKQEGVYRVILTIKGGDVYKSSQERIVQVRSMPYIMIEKPSADSTLHFRKSLSVEASLFYNGKSVRPEDEFSDHPGVLALAQVVQAPDGGKSESIWLDPAHDSRIPGQFRGILPVEIRQEGRYVLMVKLSGQLRSRADWPGDCSEIAFFSKPSLWQGTARAIVWAFYTLAAVIVIILIILIVWVITLPRMQGYLYIYPADGGSSVPLAQPRLERKKYILLRVKKSGNLPARRIWVNRDRRDRTRVLVRYWERLRLRSRRVRQNESTNISRTHSVKYM